MTDGPVAFFHVPKTGGLSLTAAMVRQYPRGRIKDLWLQKPETISEFLAMPQEERERIWAVTGHFPFGIHEHLAPHTRYVTLLRDPVKRLLSEYRHLADTPEDWGVWQAPGGPMRLAAAAVARLRPTGPFASIGPVFRYFALFVAPLGGTQADGRWFAETGGAGHGGSHRPR